MIAAIQGEVFSCSEDSVIIMTGGVGYELYCTPATLADLSQKKSQVSLLVYTHVTQDNLILFGFASTAEKQLYLSLLKVNGIGARTALHILSGASVNDLLQMIEREDIKALSKLPKVGKKTAEQMILTLKGKLVLAGDVAQKTSRSSVSSEISFALINLGFRSQDVEKVVAGMPADIAVEEGIRRGLSALSSL